MTTQTETPAEPMFRKPSADAFGVIRPPRDEDEIPRDGRKRPYVLVPDGKGGMKLTTYTRVTTYIDAIEDKDRLSKWHARMVAIGVAMGGQNMALQIGAHRDDRNKMDELCDLSKEAAQANDPSRVGTALHALTERMDLGLDLGHIPPAFRGDLDAWARATKHLRWLHIERFMVNDEYETGGTPDRIFRWKPCPDCGGRYYVGDLKTGQIEYAPAKMGRQLALYGHSLLYDRVTGERLPLPVDLCLCRGVIFQIRPTSGHCNTEWVDMRKGWAQIPLCKAVREARKERAWLTPVTLGVDILGEIETATTVERLRDIWRDNRAEWDADVHTPALHARRAVLDALA